ncbi:related to RNA binding motif protein [Cephalotrichum gorgonifer]|uniref:Related to RNA binding motif protein n=1 Tax=Cephalotrichum gorgonifer TaxID=2041049 RepID=A0AAE8STA3_9PEZI|nr:related to RNA binding motif protein [Cephalotrichum gorgonifer]
MICPRRIHATARLWYGGSMSVPMTETEVIMTDRVGRGATIPSAGIGGLNLAKNIITGATAVPTVRRTGLAGATTTMTRNMAPSATTTEGVQSRIRTMSVTVGPGAVGKVGVTPAPRHDTLEVQVTPSFSRAFPVMFRSTRLVVRRDYIQRPAFVSRAVASQHNSTALQSCVISSSILSSEDFVDIRIPPTGGQRRAFVQFHDVSDASDFVDKHFPELTVELPPREGAVGEMISLYVHFARSRDDGDRKYLSGGQWECPSCDFSNFATRVRCKMCGWAQSSAAPGYQQALTGETDASNDASQFLVVYPLDACVTEEVLEFGMKKLEVVEKQQVSKDSGVPAKPLKSTAPTGDATGYGARRGSLHRVFLIRDKSSGQTLKYGFAEFWTLEDAMAALTKFRMSRSFTIGGTPVAIFSIHMGVFVPDMQPPTAEDDKFSFVPLFNPTLRVKYWDPRVYASQRIVNPEPPKKLESTEEGSNNSTEGKRAKKRKADGSLGSAAAKKPVAMAGQMAMWQKKSQELHSGRAATTPDHRQDSEETRSRSPAAIPANEGPIKITLGGMAKAAAKPELPDRAAPRPTTSEQPLTTPAADAPISFVDRERVCCLLCMMKYKSTDDLNTHERSGNHKKAMADEEKVKAAMPRLAARDKRAQEKAKSEEERPQYRDRAKERREVFNQPNKPAPPTSKAKSGGGKAEAVRKPDVAKKPDVAAAPKPSKGSAMLAKMGWAGQGLGANGEGRTEAIAANLYQQGVGLGAEGGNLGDAGEVAARKTEGGYKGYVTSVQEKARERYNKLGEQGGGA